MQPDEKQVAVRVGHHAGAYASPLAGEMFLTGPSTPAEERCVSVCDDRPAPGRKAERPA